MRMTVIGCLGMALLQGALLAAAPDPAGATESNPPNPYWEQRRKAWESMRSPKKEDGKDKDDKKPSAKALLEQRLRKPDQFVEDTGNLYTLPGMVVNKDGVWEGSDNIFNISDNIAVGAEISVQDAGSFPVKEQDIRNRVRAIFQQGGINPQALVSGDKPPLPLLNIVIIAQPIDKGYAMYVGGHLLEDVDVRRIKAEEGAVQAITWEREHLIVAPSEEVAYHINKTVEEIAYSFVKVYRFYKDLAPAKPKKPSLNP